MAELAHFKNFAKLKDTSIEFNNITVLAGKPGTGKSYVMKMMYAVEEGLNKAQKDVLNFSNKTKKSKDFHAKFKDIDIKSLSKEKQLKFIAELQNFLSIDNELSNIKKQISTVEELYKNILNSVFSSLSAISNSFEVDFKHINFIYKKNHFSVDISNEKEKLSDIVIFVETPLILELHKHMDRRKAKTPYHIESLLNILDEDYSFTDEEQDKFIKEFSQKVNVIIGGDIKNRNGSFVYSRNNDKDYNIFNASSGIKSIGLLQYLVTNKALKKGSVLFWEEPEVHLHPEWQKKMIELFLELMNAGIKIVFSTHSPYMCEYLNALSKNRKLTDRVSFNLLQEDNGVVENVILKDSENWDLIQSELLDPLEEIAWEYL